MSELEKAFEAGTHWKEKYSKIVDDDIRVPDFKQFALQNNIGTCKWKHVNNGMMGFDDWEWETSCNKRYDSDNTNVGNYCPNCGQLII